MDTSSENVELPGKAGVQDDTAKFSGMVQDVVSRLSELPLGNSMYQELTLVAGEHPTPARIAQQMLLQANTRIDALRGMFYEKRKIDIRIEALKKTLEKINAWEEYSYEDSVGYPELDKELIEIEIEQTLVSRWLEQGRIRDLLSSLAFLYENIKNLPRFSRSDFESQEEEYFAKKLSKLVEANPHDAGAKLSLRMVIDRPAQGALLLSGVKVEESKDFAKRLDVDTLERTLLPLLKPNHLLSDGRNND